MTRESKVMTNFYADRAQIAWLKAEALRRRCSMAQVVRDLINDEIERRERAEDAG